MILSRWQKLLQEVVVLYLNATHANKYRLFSPFIFVLNIYKIVVYEIIGEDKIFRHERIIQLNQQLPLEYITLQV